MAGLDLGSPPGNCWFYFRHSSPLNVSGDFSRVLVQIFKDCGNRRIPSDDSSNRSDRGLTFNHTGNLLNCCWALNNPSHHGGLSMDCDDSFYKCQRDLLISVSRDKLNLDVSDDPSQE